MTTQNKRKLAVLNKENCEEHPGSNLAQNSNAPRSQEDYITQVSEKIEGRVTKRLSKEFSRTEKPHSTRISASRRFSYEPATTGPLRNHYGALPERIKYNLGNE